MLLCVFNLEACQFHGFLIFGVIRFLGEFGGNSSAELFLRREFFRGTIGLMEARELIQLFIGVAGERVEQEFLEVGNGDGQGGEAGVNGAAASQDLAELAEARVIKHLVDGTRAFGKHLQAEEHVF